MNTVYLDIVPIGSPPFILMEIKTEKENQNRG